MTRELSWTRAATETLTRKRSVWETVVIHLAVGFAGVNRLYSWV